MTSRSRKISPSYAVDETCFLTMIYLILIILSPNTNNIIVMAGSSPPQFPAMFAFGDSLIDNGNNNYLSSLAKANYVPYGIDFNGGQPTGRFCNGKTIIDFLGELVGLPYIPAYEETLYAQRPNIVRGVNYASAAAGILDESGRQLGERFSVNQQIQNFERTVMQLKSVIMDAKQLNAYLAKSLTVMILGSNDYLNNYLMPALYPTSYIYNTKDYADLLINRYRTQILALYNLGLRKFLVTGVGPLGCMPNQIAAGLAPTGKCVAYVNDMVEMFNTRLKPLVDELNASHPDATFVYGNTFRVFMDILDNANSYGLSVTDRGCCGVGRNRGQITCLPLAIPCTDRDQHVFWDAFHPTQAVNQIIARQAYMGSPSSCYPINVEQMATI